MQKFLQAVAILYVAAIVGACSEKPPAAPPPPATNSGRPETASIRNTEAVGTGGQAIANKVDAALNANDASKENLDKALENQGQ
jgi:hypothetical protein